MVILKKMASPLCATKKMEFKCSGKTQMEQKLCAMAKC